MDKTTCLKIFFPNGSFHTLRYTPSTSVANLIRIVIKGRLSPYELFYHLSFALRITSVENEQNSASKTVITDQWLHPNLTVEKIQQTYGSIDDLKFELRLRYFPESIDALALDKPTFNFFYEQLRIDYMRFKSEHVSLNEAIELGSLEIRKLFKDLNSTALDKKVNMDYLEKELGLRKFFPQTLLDSYKPKVLRKYIKSCLKKYEGLGEEECVKQFCFLLKNVWNWEREIFICNLGSEWAVPINLVLGPTDGISYQIENSPNLTKMTLFENVLSINTDDRALLKLSIAGSSETLTFSFSSPAQAHDVATLIDGYCMLVNRNSTSLWRTMLDEEKSSTSTILISHPSDFLYETADDNNDDEDDDYADILAPEYEIDRKQIQMIESLGNGQFGEVYRGILKTDQHLEINIAIKTCKMQDTTTTETFLDEAYVMQKFDHPHIIKLLGVCTERPVLLIMELARLGELRTYLVANRNDFDVHTLILYCVQLASALEYLESKKFVHRDIAARNILVSNHETVKLADFGLSRQLILDNSYYKASKGKLPIKWMAPESINFRRFTHLSDVWMFAVCMWEILTLGKKPFQGIPNPDVIDQIENGIRLPIPGAYCPKNLYDLFQECWSYEPTNRPHFNQIHERLKTILNEENISKTKKIFPIEEHVPPKPALPSRHGFNGSRFPIHNHRLIINKNDQIRTNSEQKTTSEKNLKSKHLIELFHNQTKQIVSSVLALTRQNENDSDSELFSNSNRPLSPINDREQMQLVKNIAIAVRDLLQTLEHAPISIKEMCEQRYNHFSNLVVLLIETVRQRNYEQMNEHAMNIARTAKALFDDILQLS